MLVAPALWLPKMVTILVSARTLLTKIPQAAMRGLDANGFLKPAEFISPINKQTGSTYTVASSDNGKLLEFNYTSGIMAVSLPAAGSTGFAAGWFAEFINNSTSAVEITVTTSTVLGCSVLFMPPGCFFTLTSDGINYQLSGVQANQFVRRPFQRYRS